MRFATDVIAVNLREYQHSPQLLADLARHGYELFDPNGYVLFRKHLAIKPTIPTSQATAPVADAAAEGTDQE